ncbi:MAG: RluA family pseudouridine synthase [Spirochaetia bacterium]
MNTDKYDLIHSGPDDIGRRADRVLRIYLESLPLGRIYSALRKGEIRVNGRKIKQDYRIREGDVIWIRKFLSCVSQDKTADISREKSGNGQIIPWVIHENRHILCINKPSGIPVHGKDSLLEKIPRQQIERKSLSFRIAPLHRLDRNTSGIVCFSKSIQGARRFSELLSRGEVLKEYYAVLDGIIEGKTVWKDRLRRDRERKITEPSTDGRESVTRIFPIEQREGKTLVKIILETGRTHQIRAQAAHRGVPLWGDTKYSGVAGGGRYILHAGRLAVPDGEAILGFRELSAPFPSSSADRLDTLFPGWKKKVHYQI